MGKGGGAARLIVLGIRAFVPGAFGHTVEHKQGVAGIKQLNALGHGGERQAAAIIQGGQPALGLQYVELGQQFHGCPRAGQFCLKQGAQVDQNLTFFFSFFAFQFLKAVVDLHQKHGLKIAGFARLRPVVDNALHAALEVGLEGQHITVGRERHELVLQVGQHVVLLGKILDLMHAALVQTAQFAAQTVELGRAFVAQQAIV